MPTKTRSGWTIADSQTLYNIEGWGASYFHINDRGHIEVTPQGQSLAHLGSESPRIDLYELTRDLHSQGLSLPLLFRFTDIVADRIRLIAESFNRAIAALSYPNVYRGVYPVKVNQQRHLVEEVVACGRAYQFGLEAGSKPELLIALAKLTTPGALIVCNGYKDRDYISIALLAQRLGHTPIIVLERSHELPLVLQAADRLGIDPILGVRAKLSVQGSGYWEASTGDRAKFGLSASAILDAVEQLRAAGRLHCLQLLHYHIGSQVPAVSTHGQAAREASQIFVQLAEMGASMRYLDIGGGLGIDYDGSQSLAASSLAYEVEDYASSVVQTVLTTCKNHQVEPPVLVSESGRAAITHQAVLVFDILGTEGIDEACDPQPLQPAVPCVQQLLEHYEAIPGSSLLADFRRAQELKQLAMHQFTEGRLSLSDRAAVERLFWHCCIRLQDCASRYTPGHPAIVGLETLGALLASTYYGNFSIFQSIPDSWAIDQVFPIVPLHRLDEKPTQSATIADLTCDSDGKIDRFIGPDGRIAPVLPLHEPGDRPYWLGIFLTGSYQEILGDLHNLFGDTTAVHVRLGEGGEVLTEVIPCDSVADVLGYVQYDRDRLLANIRQRCTAAIRQQQITPAEACWLEAHIETSLKASTYLQGEAVGWQSKSAADALESETLGFACANNG